MDIHVTYDQMRSKANHINTTASSTLKSALNSAHATVYGMSKNWKGNQYNQFAKWYSDSIVPSLDKVLAAIEVTIPTAIMDICRNYQRNENVTPYNTTYKRSGNLNRGVSTTDIGSSDFNSAKVEADIKKLNDTLDKSMDIISGLVDGFKSDEAWKSTSASGAFVSALKEQRKNISDLKADIVREINKAIKARNEQYTKTENANTVS